MEQKDLQGVLEGNLARQMHWIGAADSKLGFVFTLDTAMLGLLAALAPKAYTDWTVLTFFLALGAAGLGLLCLGFLSAAAFPRTSGPQLSMIYCGGVAQRSAGDFAKCVQSMSLESYIEDLIAQCHRNAEIAARKFVLVRRAQVTLHFALPIWLCAVWLLYRGK